MELSLAKLIEEQADYEAFSHHAAGDIMAQIARGMCCLHGLRVAHRDLKPHNVVLNRLTSSHNEGNYHVKLVDYGVSKTQVEPLRTTTTESGFGTTAYKAPEVRSGPPGNGIGDGTRRAVWFKADVWSFAITCLHILCRKAPPLLHGDADVESVLAPESCPGELVELLQDCLKAVSRDRPDFLEICTRLEKLRHNLLRGGISQEVTASHEFIEKVMCEHFEEQSAGKLPHDDEGEPLDKSISSDARLLELRGPFSCDEQVYHDRAEKLLHKRERFSFTRDVVPDPMSPPPPKQTTLWVFAVLVLFSSPTLVCKRSFRL